jgi:hypothetical protein
VEKDLAPIRLCDETESAVSDDSLDRAFCHLRSPIDVRLVRPSIYVLTTSEHK